MLKKLRYSALILTSIKVKREFEILKMSMNIGTFLKLECKCLLLGVTNDKILITSYFGTAKREKTLREILRKFRKFFYFILS